MPEISHADDANLLHQIVRTCYDVMTSFEREVGISQSRLQVIALLRKHNELSQAELQRRLRVDGAAITRQVKQLEEEGVVTRRADPADNRFTLVALTPAGHATADGLIESRTAFERRAVAGLRDVDLAATDALLAQIRANLRG